MADSILVAGIFTKSDGQPAIGETLTDFDFYLTAVHRTTGAETVIWDGTQSADAEIDNIGAYRKIYANGDLSTYHYLSRIDYTGATVLDSDYVYGAIGVEVASAVSFPAGAVEFTYTLTNSVTGNPIADADIWFTTDSAGNNVVWRGTTDAFGIARDVLDRKPDLDPGTYYVWRQKIGFSFDDPDIEVVS